MAPLPASKLAEVRELCERFRVRRLDLFGSAARKPLEEANDLDFLVEFEPLPEGTHADHYFGLHEALEATLGKHVDLVMVTAIVNPYFRAEVDRTKSLVYGRTA